ncbi:MAG: OmpA family protein [Planctomycetes bacterium]|nr:OmpA family protein [Planctomycetota bacterium]
MEPRVVEVEVEQPPRSVSVVAETRRTLIKLRRPVRPVHVYEVEATAATYLDGGLLPQPAEALGALAAALDHAAARPDDVVVVIGHGARAQARAQVVAALLAGDADAFAAALAGQAGVKEWQALLAWAARAIGIACDPQGVDGVVGKNTRAALSGFRKAAGVAGGDPDAPQDADWRALLACYQEGLAGLVGATASDVAARGQRLTFLEARAVGCGGSWPAAAVQLQDHTTMADERVDVLFFRPADAPRLGCHAGGEACDAGACDVYAKGRYRCVVCGPDPRPGWTCRELGGIHFEFDRSFVRPDAFPTLGEVKALLDEQADREVMLYGHTDTVGDEAYNKKLSERRARAAAAVLTHDVAAWEQLWADEGWGDAVSKQMVTTVGGERPSRKALIQAYMQAAVPEAVPAARLRDFGGGKRYMGCSELNPVGDGADERSRRVVAMVYDRARAPRALPCKVGDLAPCRASVRPLPANHATAETATFTCAVYRRLAAQCACKQGPAPLPGPLKIESFLGRPAAGGDLAAHVTVGAEEQVVLAWRVTGATEVTLVKRDGAQRVVVATGLAGEGEREVAIGAEGTTFTLEAAAGAALELADVVVEVQALTARLAVRWHGTNFPAREDADEPLEILEGAELEVAWRVEGDPDRVVVLWKQGGPWTPLFDPAPAQRIFVEKVTTAGERQYCLEAYKGAQKRTLVITVNVLARRVRPRIARFEAQPQDDHVGFRWSIVGEYTEAVLLPLGSKHQTGAEGQARAPWPAEPRSNFTLEVWDQGGIADSALQTVERPAPPPAPPVTGELLVRRLGDEKPPAAKVTGIEKGQKVELFFRADGPWRALSISPGVGEVRRAPSHQPFGWVTVDPWDDRTLPDGKDAYTLLADGKPIGRAVVEGAGARFIVPFEFSDEWESSKFKLFKYVTAKVKAGGGIKGKAVVLGTKGETSATVKAKFGAKNEIAVELSRAVGLPRGTPRWVVDHVKKAEVKGGVKWNPLKGEISIAELKYEITCKPVDCEFCGRKFKLIPKGELSLSGVKLSKKKGKWDRSVATVSLKIGAESPVWDKLSKSEWSALPFDLVDVSVFGAVGIEGAPAWEEIGRLALETLGFEGLVTVGLNIGLVVVAAGTIYGTVKGGIEWADLVNANKQRKYAEDFYREVLAGLLAALKLDACFEDDDVPDDPPTLSAAESPRQRGEALGWWYKRRSFKEYLAQDEARRVAETLRRLRRDEGIEAGVVEREVRLELWDGFAREWEEKRRLYEYRLRKQLWDDIRKLVYMRFVRESNGTPQALDGCFRSLYMDRPRVGFDYDYPDVDDEVFEVAMANLLECGRLISRERLVETWKEAGYFLVPPDAADRRRKQELLRQREPERYVVDIRTGKLVPRSMIDTTREEALAAYKDRQLVPTGKIDRNISELAVRLGWRIESCFWGHVHIPKDPKVTLRCLMQAHGEVNVTNVTRCIVGVYSADGGSEWVEINALPPSYLRADGDEHP